MCRVRIKKTKENVDFIVYNHVFSHDRYHFTTESLCKELQKYKLGLSQDDVQHKINHMVSKGLLNQNYNGYSIR